MFFGIRHARATWTSVSRFVRRPWAEDLEDPKENISKNIEDDSNESLHERERS